MSPQTQCALLSWRRISPGKWYIKDLWVDKESGMKTIDGDVIARMVSA